MGHVFNLFLPFKAIVMFFVIVKLYEAISIRTGFRGVSDRDVKKTNKEKRIHALIEIKNTYIKASN